MTIGEFAKARGVNPETVRHFLRNHAEIRKHTKKRGKSLELLPPAVELLEKQYPVPVEVIPAGDQELKDRLLEAQQLIINLQEQLGRQQALVAQAEARLILLEDRERQLAEEKQKTADATAEVERLKSRGLIDRILNR